MSPGRGSTPRQTDWLTVSRNVTQTQLTDSEGSDNEMRECEKDAGQKRSKTVKSEMVPDDKSLVNVLYICEVNNCGYNCEYSNK
jgi:hypothetical protein